MADDSDDTSFTFEQDPRLPDNTLIAVPDDGSEPRYVITSGSREDSNQPGVKVDDIYAEEDDETVTQMSYNFVYRDGIIVHDVTEIHRHGDDGDPNHGHGACEHTPARHHPAPDIVTSIVTKYADAPVATPNDLEENGNQ